MLGAHDLWEGGCLNDRAAAPSLMKIVIDSATELTLVVLRQSCRLDPGSRPHASASDAQGELGLPAFVLAPEPSDVLLHDLDARTLLAAGCVPMLRCSTPLVLPHPLGPPMEEGWGFVVGIREEPPGVLMVTPLIRLGCVPALSPDHRLHDAQGPLNVIPSLVRWGDFEPRLIFRPCLFDASSKLRHRGPGFEVLFDGVQLETHFRIGVASLDGDDGV